MPASIARSRSPSSAPAVIATIGIRAMPFSRGADPAGRLVAVQAGHLDVHEHGDVTLAVELLERLGAVGGHVDLVSALGEHALDHELVDRVVLRDEDPPPRRRGGRGASGRGSRSIGGGAGSPRREHVRHRLEQARRGAPAW